MMRSVLQKLRSSYMLILQVFFVIAAITVIIYSGLTYAGSIFRSKFKDDAVNLITQTHLMITAELQEPETLAIVVAQSIKEILMLGLGEQGVRDYIDDMSYLLSEKATGYRFSGILVYIEDGSIFLPPTDWTDVADDFYVYDRPWYVSAIEASGDVVATPIYTSMRHGGYQISYTSQIFDDDGKSLGVAAVDVQIGRIVELVIDMRLTDTAFGFLADEYLNIVAHSHEAFIGMNVSDINTNFGQLAASMAYEGVRMIEVEDIDFRNERTMFYVEAIENGWFLGLGVPEREYFQDFRSMMAFIIVIGVIVALAISAFLIQMDRSKNKANMAYNEQLINAKDIAEQSNRSKSDFIAQISHEIRTPMNAILGISEIQMHDKSLSANAEDGFRQIRESGNLLLSIINDILDISKIDAGKMTIEIEKYDIPSLINDTIQLNLLRNESKPVDFDLHVDKDTPLELYGDELRIRQVLNNLLSNAFKYTSSGDVGLTVSTEVISNDEENVNLVLQILDTGQGMSKEQTERIFEDYSRFNIKDNKSITGTGLGMSITKRLVDMMKGEISLVSAVDKGTVVTVRLPQRLAGPEVCGEEIAERLKNYNFRPSAFHKKTKIIHEYMPYGRVLIVDDVESNLYVAKGLLSPYGLYIETVRSGFEAIDRVKSGNDYDIIFMDHMMPKMDGIKATAIIREMGYSGTIVALTANAIVGNSKMFLDNGFDGFIAKPIDTREMDQLLKQMIRDKKPDDVIEQARREMKEKESVSNSELSELHKYTAVDAEKTILAVNKFIQKTDAPDSADYESFITAVHGMKSALQNIGEAELSDVALRLERAGDIRNRMMILDTAPGFVNSLHTLIEKLKPNTAVSDNAIEMTQEDKELLREKLNLITQACEQYNISAAEATVGELKKKTWPSNVTDSIEDIFMSLVCGEFKKAVSISEELFESV